ncbi:pseudouridylate synthase [Leucobacter sp. OLJS4]|uniref:pseudouridine synthase n=1 Tax=unclassified Leucobacter TaxID=2621730 RepID=UPI000C1A17E4|nr:MULTISPECIES: pseudouridine synthase [unclassified Leucobacter]PII87206.1 pseudouridylate synthase [Leucobacter sp. OLCALW19]PII87665.1 pseudouridylate synthase [Leucobacter sp. OLTLW20]PII90404.1 pseudouridylate synthase [Leucobacter sp. OLAS13]PII97438.1 pseudouridylate synthase [Leucobacter sp. OLDS2]PIJ01076.1 pseudouridylate synthase [Leucobacter sp. OLCS4]
MPPRSPLPQRLGLDSAWMRSPDRDPANPRPWPTMRDWLHHRLSEHIDVDAFIADERFVLDSGAPLRADAEYRSHTFVWFYRDLPEETPVPGAVHVVHRDDRIVVVDKPPFLSSIPRGKHITESVVVRMRHELGLPELTPMHRLDRVTSGLLILATERRWRGAYQSMFMRGEVSKTYHAVARIRDDLALPATVRNHLRKRHGTWQGEEVPGLEPNSESLVELERELPTEGGGERRGVYRLTPRTGKTHQLRLHMLGLGIPIEGDPLYPVVQEIAVDDFSTPLQLLASELRFSDPIDGGERRFASVREFPLGAPQAH